MMQRPLLTPLGESTPEKPRLIVKYPLFTKPPQKPVIRKVIENTVDLGPINSRLDSIEAKLQAQTETIQLEREVLTRLSDALPKSGQGPPG